MLQENRMYRSTSDLESILGQEQTVLDKGFIRVVDYMGNDAAVVQAARVSHGPGTKTVRDDAALINYLVKNRHTTPLEMCEIKFHVKLPIFVARQWIRHRTANVNEISGRYSILPNEFYLPKLGDIREQSKTNKQGRGLGVMDTAEVFQSDLLSINNRAYDLYEHHLDEGVARELARTVLPVNVYTEWYWKIDLHNLLHFLNLRTDSHAQWEIREYANLMADIVKMWVPAVFEAWEEHVRCAETLSRSEVRKLRQILGLCEDKLAEYKLSEAAHEVLCRFSETTVEGGA